MKVERFDVLTPAGRARGRTVAPELGAAVLGAALARLARERSFAERCELGGRAAWIKGGPLGGRARLRHALRQKLGRCALPRVAEFENLRWLARRLFRVPRAVAAGWIERSGSAHFQFLATLEVQGARPLEEAWPELGPAARLALAHELAGEVARMHALGYRHRDLYVRNLLYAPEAAEPSRRALVFLDTWRGGAHARGRGPAHDLACLFLQGSELFSDEQSAAFFAHYALALESLSERALDRGALGRAVERERARLVRQVLADPGRARGAPVAVDARGLASGPESWSRWRAPLP